MSFNWWLMSPPYRSHGVLASPAGRSVHSQHRACGALGQNRLLGRQAYHEVKLIWCATVSGGQMEDAQKSLLNWVHLYCCGIPVYLLLTENAWSKSFYEKFHFKGWSEQTLYYNYICSLSLQFYCVMLYERSNQCFDIFYGFSQEVSWAVPSCMTLCDSGALVVPGPVTVMACCWNLPDQPQLWMSSLSGCVCNHWGFI